MGLPKVKPRYTVDQYLAIERHAEERHLFLDGEIYAMAGESDRHGIISVNLVVLLGTQLRGGPRSVRTKATKVRSGSIPMSGSATTGMFSYSDVLAVCGEPEYHDAFRDILLNPKAIFEVLSDSTEAFDRGEKFQRFQEWNPSLTDYLLVAQDRPQIEHFHRQDDGKWIYERYSSLDAVLRVESIGCSLKLADVYEGMTFAGGE